MQIGLGIGIPFIRNYISRAIQQFTPASLFANNEQGVWYDPSDLTTLFQDAAGTTPVTAVEQPVGRMLDKSGRSNHAVNNSGNSANFPVLSAKYNLLTKTEQFYNAAWTPDNVIVATNNFLKENAASSAHDVYQQITSLPVGTYKFVVAISKTFVGTRNIGIALFASSGVGGTATRTAIFSQLGQFVGFAGTGTDPTYSVTEYPTYFEFSVIGTTTASANAYPAVYLVNGTTLSYPGNNTSGLTLLYADLRVANDALNQPAYQRVNTSSDYDTVGFKQGEVFDGINDYLTASAGGGSTTSFFWCSAIRVGKVGAVQTLFSDAGTNTGYRVRINASNQLELSAGNGASYTTVSTTATLSICQRAVLTAWHDGANLNVQINNGTVHQVAFSTATAGTAQCTIGKDNNAASNFFAGWLYENVYTKDNVPSSAQIAETKAYVANIAGITL